MVMEDQKLREFLENRQIKPNTERSYRQYLNKYSKVIGLSLTALIDQAEEDEDKRLRMRQRRIKFHLQNFRNQLQSEGKTYRTIKTALTIVGTFYKEFEIELPKQKIKSTSTERKNIEHIPTKDNIRTAIEYANPKYQAIITLMASSGMGSSEIRNLKVNDLLKALNIPIKKIEKALFDIRELIDLVDGSTIPTWQISRVKTGKPYFTFSTPESLKYILRFLELYPPESVDDYLFPAAQYGGKLGESGFAKYFKKINEKCGFPMNGSQIFFRSQSLPKYFETILMQVNLPQLKIDWLLGHRIDKTTEAYFKATPDGLKRDYLKLMRLLVFMEDVKIREVTDERLQELEREIEDVKKTKKILEDILGIKLS
jgi:integrase